MDYVIRGGLKAGDLKAGGGLKEDGREARESDCGGKTRQIKLNRQSPDPRVKELEAIFAGSGYNVADLNDAASGRTIYFFEPRCRIDCGVFDGAAVGSIAFGYAKELPECAAASGIKYVCLSDDETFVQRNNYLTALALKQIIGDKEYGRPKRGADGQPKQGVRPKRKMLVCGWGKLAGQIEKVFDGWDIHILNFNIHKVPELTDKYGSRAYFETAPFEKFCIVVNTIPKEVIRAAELPKRKTQTIYDLASPPYGFNWKGADKADFNYRVEPALPGRYFPRQAAEAVAECIQRHLETLVKPTVVLCITGSSCSYLKLLPILKDLAAEFDILPVLSENANVPNRFTDIDGFKDKIREITGHNIITNIAAAETLSADKRIRCAVIFPATGNTIAKLTHAVTDTCVLMAVKALLRNAKPCVIGISTNDALSGNAKNIGELLNRRNIYFVPFGQDDAQNKPYSCICDFTKVKETIKAALDGRQLQPVLLK